MIFNSSVLCTLLTFVLFFVVIIYFLIGVLRPRNFPPGPRWLPIVGNTPVLRKLSKKLNGQHNAMSYLANKYKTEILGLKFGSDLFVVVFSESLIYQVFTQNEFQARPDSFFIRLRSMGTRKGITMTDGPLWEEHKSFTLKHLRELGFGKTLMEDLILEELRELITKLGKGGETTWSKYLSLSVLNVLWALAAGSRFASGDPQLDGLLQLMDKRKAAFDMSGGILSQMPWIRHIAPDYSGYNLVKNLNNKLSQLLLDSIAEHKKTLQKDKTRDYIDAFLHKMNAANGKPTTFTDDQLIMVCLDFFIAGSQTTSNTLDFALLNVLLRPDMQKRIQTEIDGVLPNGKLPSLSHRNRLHFTEAFLLESQRFCHVVPVAGPRRTLNDTELSGYSIPKGATILLSLQDFHHNKKKWNDPDVFRPERFLDSNGEFCPEQLYLFGYGRRRCIGETLGKQCLFLFFVGLMKHFTLERVPDKPQPTFEVNPGITLSPKTYSVILTSRIN